MVREIQTEELGDIVPLMQKYVQHVDDSFTTLDSLMKWYRSGLSKGTLCILAEYSSFDEVIGFLVHGTQSNRTAVIYANQNFEVEKYLFDYAFKMFSVTSPFLIFESGYPTPWISNKLSEYVQELDFAQHDRQYMSLEDNHQLLPIELPSGLQVRSYSDSMVEEVSRLVFRSVNGTIDQDLFPYVYGTYELTEKYHKQVVRGDFGTHKDSYSWVLKRNAEYVGSCFMILMKDDTGGVMHLAIVPEHRQMGLGRILLTHSLINLFKIEPSITKIDLAVTTHNPARILYESVGFKKVNDSSTYVWKS
jgi:ribosomal protein S18 acetylase RimI-like enzyme